MGWEALRKKQQLDFLVPYDEMTCWRQLLWAGYDKNTKVGCTRSFSLFSKRLWSTPFALKFLIGVFPLEVKWKPEISPSALSTPSFIFFSHSFQSSSLSTFNYFHFDKDAEWRTQDISFCNDLKVVWGEGIWGQLCHLDFLLHTRIHDSVHSNDPVDNCKSNCNDGADEVRHERCLSKSLFSFFALLLGIPSKILISSESSECQFFFWNFCVSFELIEYFSFLETPAIKTFQGLTLYLFIDRKQFIVWRPEKIFIQTFSKNGQLLTKY